MRNVVFCSSVPVPEEDEAEFLASFSRLATLLSKKRGFVSSNLHRGLSSSFARTFLVQIEWADSSDLMEVLRSAEVADFRRHVKWKGSPAIYEPVEF